MSNRVKLALVSIALVLFMTFPSTVRAGSVGNQGEVEFYYEDSRPEPTGPEKPTPTPTPTTPSQAPSKVLNLPQAGEKLTSYYLMGIGMILVAGIWFWKGQRSKGGSSEH